MCPGEISICTSSHCYSYLMWLFRKLLWALCSTKELMSMFCIRLYCMKAVLSKCQSGWCCGVTVDPVLMIWSHCCPNDLEQVILLQNCLPNQTSGIMIWVAGSIDRDMADWKNLLILHSLCAHPFLELSPLCFGWWDRHWCKQTHENLFLCLLPWLPALLWEHAWAGLLEGRGRGV